MSPKSISAQAFRVRYLRRSRRLYRKFLESKPWISHLYREFLGLRAGIRIVEVGCGTGDFTRYLARLCAGRCYAMGIDNRSQSLRAATTETKLEGLSKAITYKVGDALRIPLADNYSDLTCCRTLLMHLKDPMSAIREMARVTRVGGHVVGIEGGRMVSYLDPEDEEYTRLSRRAHDAWTASIRRLERKEFKIGDWLPSLFHKAGLAGIQAEVHADAWLNCDPRRKLKDVKDQIRFELSLSRENRRLDRRYLLAGGFPRTKIGEYFKTREMKAFSLLQDERKIREDTSFYGASFVLVKGRKMRVEN